LEEEEVEQFTKLFTTILILQVVLSSYIFISLVKIVEVEYLTIEEQEILMNEMNIMSKLNHENVIKYFGSKKTPKNLYLFMGLYKGSLTSLITKQREKNIYFSVSVST
jgi:serine/threonine protein kinase